MKTHIASLLLLALSLSSCFKVPLSATGKLDGSSSGTVQAASTALGEGKEYASVDSDSKEPVQLTTPKASGLSGASVVIAPGSLGISVSIVVEQASDFAETSIANEMGLADNIQVTSASAGMIIRPSENVDLKKPLSLAMPLPTGLGFRLANLGSKYAIFYKYFDPTEQKLVTGLKVVDGVNVKMVFDEKSGKDVLQFEGYFGAYWAAILSREVAVSEVPPPKASEEPIINKAKVAVYNSTGVVKETEVVAKQAIADLVWDKPTIKFLAATRSVSASVAVPKGHQASACKVDFFEAPNLPKGISLEVPLGTFAEYSVVKATEHSLIARFRCVDEESRITITPWSNAITIPALVMASVSTPADDSAALSEELCSTAGTALYAQGYNENGQFAVFQNFLPNGKCKYRASFTIENPGNFYIANANSTIICGLATHTLVDGAQNFTCQKGNYSNIGSNYMTIPAGVFTVDLDFSQSSLSPTFTLTRAPCDRGDFYLLFADSPTNPVFPAISAASKMKHLGGCEYVYENTALPLTANGAMQIRNAAGTYSCGQNILWGPNQGMYDHCGTGALRFDQFQTPEVAQSHRITLSLGDAAKARTNNYAQESYVQYNVVSSCPSQLFMLSTASGLVPDYQKNGAYRRGACRYEFPVLVENADKSVYNFKIANQAGAILCGGSSTGGNITLNCNANAPAVNFEGELGKALRISISGNALNGQLTSADVSRLPMYCDGGVYLQNEFVNGMSFSKEKAFQEVSECLFEKIWTPTAANPGFYVASGNSSDICGNSMNPANQPSLNGAAGALFCNSIQYANNISKILPVSLVTGNSYKITVDKRRNNGGQNYVSIVDVTAQSSECNEDLYVFGIQGLGSERNSATRMTREGNCNYSFTFNTTSFTGTSLSYSLHGETEAYTCFKADASPGVNGTNPVRSALLSCNSSTVPLAFDFYYGSTYRFNFKRDPAGLRNELTVQNLNSYSNPKIAGNAASLIPVNDRGFKFPLTSGLASTFIWTRSSAADFVIDRNGFGYEYCGFDDQGTAPMLGSPMDVICRFGTAAAAPVFGSWSPGSYVIEFLPARSIEEKSRVRVMPYDGFSLSPLLAATIANADDNRPAVGTVGQESTSFTPGALEGAATWSDSLGYLWAYGGGTGQNAMSSAMWRFDPSSKKWAMMSGSLTGNAVPQPSYPAHPGAKKFASSWYDADYHRLYLFGGRGVGTNGGQGEMNDLWYYDRDMNSWHFVKGGLDVNAAGNYGTMGEVDGNNYPPPRMGASSWKDANGILWLFGGLNGVGRYNDLWKFVTTSGFDAAAGSWAWMGGNQENVDAPGSNVYPSARSDAKVWFSGANAYMFGGTAGGTNYNDLWTLNCSGTPQACSWNQPRANTADAPMALARRAVFGLDNHPRYYGGAAHWVNPANGDLWLYTERTFWVYRPSIYQWAGFPKLDSNGFIFYGNPSQWLPSWADSVFNPNNDLGMRSNPLVWTSGTRSFIYGGYGFNVNGQGVTWSDMWELQLPSN